MCLVIDTCALTMVFDGGNKKHAAFAPVLKWVTVGKGRMIYGGTKYNAELGKLPKVFSLVIELSKQRKTIQLSNSEVDPIAAQLKTKFPAPDFNDEHIVALVIASRCRVVCTNDNVAISYLRRPDVFAGSNGVMRPSIYRGYKTHKKLCCDEHLVSICRET